uniref:Uncharacterized protein n=1 Tax=Oryza meridionalis TaxID=40149 RepID=A0A0E0DSL3_9ORYZ
MFQFKSQVQTSSASQFHDSGKPYKTKRRTEQGGFHGFPSNFFSTARLGRDGGGRHDRSAAEAVEGAALALERVDDVHGGDGLAAGVLGVGDGVADDVLEEDLEHAAGLLVDEPGDALHAAPPRQPPDRRLGDPLDVVAEHLPVTLGAALAEPLASLAAPRHGRRRRRFRWLAARERQKSEWNWRRRGGGAWSGIWGKKGEGVLKGDERMEWRGGCRWMGREWTVGIWIAGGGADR